MMDSSNPGGSMKTLTRPAVAKPIQPKPTPKFWLAINLHSRRKKLGLTQEQLAESAGISVRSLRDIENAVPESNPELKTITALADALEIEVGALFKHRPESELVDV
jgi:DNA-binding XRE family transcriptional regulator